MAIEAAKLLIRVDADTSGADRGLRSVNDKLNNTARQAGVMGGVLTAGVTLPLLAMGNAALVSAGDFEQSGNITQQILGATAEQMQVMQAAALDWGAESVFSAGEVMAAMQEGAKAGLDYQQIMEAMPGIIDLAAASGEGLASSMGITAAAMNTFGLDASESTSIASMFAAAANASAASIPDLAQGMQQAGFAFAAANQTLPDLLASLAILTNVGLTGSDSGTALKNAFMRLMDPTKEAKSLMDELGISVYDAQGNMLAMPQIIDTFNAGLAGLTQEQRNAALTTIFLSDGFKAMNPLLNAGSAGFKEMQTSVTAQGAASSTAAARMAGMSGAVEYFTGSIESFMIGQATPFLDFLAGAIRGAADFVTGLGTLPAPLLAAALAFLGVMAAAGPVILGVGLLAGALAFLLSPIGLVVVATAGLAAAWASDFGGIQAKTAEVWAAMQPHFAAMTGWLNTEGPAAIATLQSSWNEAWPAMESFFAPVIPRLTTAWGTMIAGFGELGPKFGELFAAAEGPLNRLMQLGAMVGVVLMGVFSFAVNGISAVMGRLPDIVGVSIDQLTISLTLIGTTVEGVIALVAALISGDWAGAWTAAQTIFTGFVTYFFQTSQNLGALLGFVYGALRDTVVGTFSDMGVNITDHVTAVETEVTRFWNWITGLTWGDITAGVSAGFTGAVDALVAWVWPSLSALTTWDWPSLEDLVGWEWPGFPKWEWPDIPMPPWLGGFFDRADSVENRISDFFRNSFGGGNDNGSTGGNDDRPFFDPGNPYDDDTGGGNFPGGFKSSRALTPALAGGGGNITIYATVANDIDLNELAMRIAQAQRRRG